MAGDNEDYADDLERGFNDDRSSATTIEALAYSLRKGVDALARPDILRQLSDLDDQQFFEMVVRLQKRDPRIAPQWTEEELRILAAVRKQYGRQDA